MKNRTRTRRVLGIASSLLMVGAMVSLTGCLTPPVAPYVPFTGATFSIVSFPIDIKYEETPVAQSYGTTSAHSVLGLVSWGDASVMGAATQGDLDTVDYVDARYMNIWFIYSQTRIDVAGRGGKYPSREEALQAAAEMKKAE